MEQQKQLKSYLEFCRRLGVRYVSMGLARTGLKAGPAIPAKAEVAVAGTPPIKMASGAKTPFPAMPVKPSGRDLSRPFERSSTPQGRPPWMSGSEGGIQAMELMAFERDICECQKCPLGKTRKNFVFGSGNPQAEVVFVGEAPGRDEDEQGMPFVGAAGKLLTKIIESTKLWKREDVFICNILKCRPPGNRTPLPEEMEKCLPYLEEQIQILKPRFIIALGAVAAHALLRNMDSVGKLRGRWHDFNGIPLRVTYHPAALLRYEGYKKDVWEDIKELSRKYNDEKNGA